jgi:hypothetical protein
MRHFIYDLDRLVLTAAVILVALCLFLQDGCAETTSSLVPLDRSRLVTNVDLALSIRRDLPDSGPVQIKGQGLICNLLAMEKNAGMTPQDAGGIACPTPR